MFSMCVEHAIITFLATEKDLTIQQLHEKIKAKKMKVSLPNFYKIIARMVDSQMLVKTNGKLQIHAMYLHYIGALCENIQTTYFSDKAYNVINLPQGEHKVFTAPSFYDLDIIWMNLLSQLIKHHPEEEGFYYNSHPYHVLSITDKEKANMEEVGRNLRGSYFLFGNNTFLDQYGGELFSMQGYNLTCTDESPFPEEGYFVNIIGDYIIECMLPDALVQHYKIFFDTVNSLDEFNIDMFSNIMKMRTNCSLKLIHSPEHAKKMKNKIKKYFG